VDGWASKRGRANALRRYRSADDPEVLDAVRDLRLARAEDYIQQLVDQAPPLTPAQRRQLAAVLLRGAA
jgi:hypothetical protein